MKSLEKMHNLEIEKKDIELENQLDLTKSIITSQEAERERIARDMHDSFTGELLRIQYKVGMHQSISISELTNLVTKTRSIIHDLSPPMINESSIDLLIENEVNRYIDCFENQIYRNVNNVAKNMTSDSKINILRVFQELLQNTFKHANAYKVIVSIYERQDLLLLVYQDICEAPLMKYPDKSEAGNGHKNIKFRNQYLQSDFKFRWIKGYGLKYSMLIKFKHEKGSRYNR
ncbi:MAG: sensor histidine kinase [Flavobacterium sp.]